MVVDVRVAVAVACSLISTVASAQLPPIILAPLELTTSTGQTTYTFGATACTATIPVTWTNNSLLGTPCGDMQVWTTTGECGDAPNTTGGDVILNSVIAALVLSVRTGTFDIDTATQLPGFLGADAGVCGAPNTQITMNVCASIQLQAGLTCIANHAQPLEISYDTQAPPVPTIATVTAEDGALQVGVTASSDTLEVDVQAMGGSDEGFGHDIQIDIANSTTGTIHDLIDSTPYQLRAYAVDQAGNQSGFSDIVMGTPLQTFGFWDVYRRDGGEAQGCSGVAGAPLLLATLLWLRRRRSG